MYQFLFDALKSYEKGRKIRGKSAQSGRRSKAELDRARGVLNKLNREKYPDVIFGGQEVDGLSIEKIKELLQRMKKDFEISGLEGKAIRPSSSERKL